MLMCRALITLIAAVLLAAAQNVSSGLSGTIVDTTEAVIPGVKVVARQVRTGFEKTSASNESGYFSFPDLASGEYTISIQHGGFRKYQQTDIGLNAGEQRSLGRIRLQVGETADTVTVEATSAQVQLGSSEKSASITQEDLQNLALRGRDVMDAVGLLPGVVDTSEGRESASGGVGGLFLAGGRDNAKNVSIDGVTSLDTGSNGGVHSMPSMDSVGEVKVLLSNYAAEYGRNSGGAITIITRGGGKKFHGSASYFNRHERYSANSFFNNQRGVARQPYRYNISNYTINGPVYLPGKWNRDRSKLFFFWSQEFQNQFVEYGSRTVTVPTALERAGDFSKSLDTNGRARIVRDPLTERDATSNNKLVFPGNLIPPSRLHPLGQKILGIFPLPNFVDPSASRVNQWNFLSAQSGNSPRRTDILRLDYQPFTKLQTYLRVSNTRSRQEVPWGLWVNGAVNIPLTPIDFNQPGRGATLNMTYTVTPTIFNELILGVSQNHLTYAPLYPDRVNRTKLGINVPQFNPALNADNLIPNFAFGGVQNAASVNMSDGVPYDNSNLILSLVENVSKIYKTHTFRFGVYYERSKKDQSANAATRGSLDFGVNALSEYDTNFAYSNAILGSYNSYTEASARPRGYYYFTNLEFYAQDAWRVKPNLLIDFGVRFYANQPTYDKLNQLYTFAPDAYDPAKAPALLRPALDANRRTVAQAPDGTNYPEGFIGTFAPGVGVPAIGMIQGGKNGLPRGLYEVPKLMAAPRFGFAWDPFRRGRTAIRGGGGVFFDRIQGNMTYNMLPNPPSIFTPTVYFGTLDGLAETSGKGVLAPSGTVRAIFGNNPMPTTYNFSLGLQQQVGKSFLMDISYVGALSRHQLWQRNINAIPLSSTFLDRNPQNRNPARPTAALSNNFLRPLQGYGDIFLYEFAAASNYNSVQTRFSQRLSRSLNWAVSYTFSKALGTASSDGQTINPFFSPREWNYGPLTYDRTQVLAVNYNWTVPWKHRLARGWQFSGVTRGQTGAPFTPGIALVTGGDITGSASFGTRLVVMDPAAPLTERFRAPARGELGNIGTNIYRGPGFLNHDLSLYRNFKLERTNTQLRLETYNTLNHTQYSSQSTTARFENAGATNQIDPLFLEPTNARSQRRIQIAIRVTF